MNNLSLQGLNQDQSTATSVRQNEWFKSEFMEYKFKLLTNDVIVSMYDKYSGPLFRGYGCRWHLRWIRRPTSIKLPL